MNTPQDGGPAFPVPMFTRESDGMPMSAGEFFEGVCGMTLRDWFAGQALAHVPELLTAHNKNRSLENIAGWAYYVADGMIKARNQHDNNPTTPVLPTKTA